MVTGNPLPKAVRSCAASPCQFTRVSSKNVTNPCSTFHKVNFFKILMCIQVQMYIEEIVQSRIFKFAYFIKNQLKNTYISRSGPLQTILHQTSCLKCSKTLFKNLFALLHGHYSSRYGIYSPLMFMSLMRTCVYIEEKFIIEKAQTT